MASTSADYLAAATLRSALVARRGEPDWGEHEVGQIAARQLADWTREAAPFATTGRPSDSQMAPGDARSVWVVVLLLLGIEFLVRRARVGRASIPVHGAGHADAA